MTDPEPPDAEADRLARNRHYNPDLEPGRAGGFMARFFSISALFEVSAAALGIGVLVAMLSTVMPLALALLAGAVAAAVIGVFMAGT